jgi:lipoate-protein ligase B
MKLIIHDLGAAAYRAILELQQLLVDQVASQADAPGHLLLVEHDPPVITLGRSASADHVLVGRDVLDARGLELHHVQRGGGATWHGPGQLVAYPILHVADLVGGLRGYMRDLEQVLIVMLGRFGIAGHRVPGRTGVWTDQGKVAAIGVAVRRWVTYHGLALNVCADLSAFKMIVPCGEADAPVANMECLLGRRVDLAEANGALVECFVEVMGMEAADEAAIQSGAGSPLAGEGQT